VSTGPTGLRIPMQASDSFGADSQEVLLAKKSLIAKSKRTPKFVTRRRNRCRLCGRPRGYIRDFALCRICFRKLARQGEIPGVVKASW